MDFYCYECDSFLLGFHVEMVVHGKGGDFYIAESCPTCYSELVAVRGVRPSGPPDFDDPDMGE